MYCYENCYRLATGNLAVARNKKPNFVVTNSVIIDAIKRVTWSPQRKRNNRLGSYPIKVSCSICSYVIFNTFSLLSIFQKMNDEPLLDSDGFEESLEAQVVLATIC